MTEFCSRRLEEYRSLLQWLARRIELDPRLQRRFDSSDLVQESLLKAQANWEQLQEMLPAQRIQWLQTTLNNVLIDEVRKASAQKRDYRMEQSLHAVAEESSARLEAFLADKQPTPGSQLQREELLLQLANAMNELPDGQRDAILLRDMHGMSIADIAQRLERTEKSVAGLLLRGRQNLRETLERES